jgi:hypothetical protein
MSSLRWYLWKNRRDLAYYFVEARSGIGIDLYRLLFLLFHPPAFLALPEKLL